MSSTPFVFTWTGSEMKPLKRFHNACAAEFTPGKPYRLAEVQDRSMRTHNHFFARVADAWQTLPEHYAQEFPTAEHLRKWCLIKAGFRDHRSIVASSKAEARRIAAFIKPMDDFAVVRVSEATIHVYTAQSQSLKAMGKATFQKSKEAVFDVLADMLDVDRETFAANIGKAA